MADDAAALLVRSGLVTTNALDDARARVASIGGTLGEQLVTSGAIADDDLTDFYRARLLVPQVNPNTLARLTPQVVAAIPGDMAIELRAIPVALDGENTLTVAMSDPSDRHAVDEIAFFTGAYVVRAVATQMQIAWCLAHYYGHVTLLGQRLLSATDADQPSLVKAAAGSPGSGRLPRAKGVTGVVNATRHRAVAPVTGPVDVARPKSDELDVRPLQPKANGAARTPPGGSGTGVPLARTPSNGTARAALPTPPPASSLDAIRITLDDSDAGDEEDDDEDDGDITPVSEPAVRMSSVSEVAITGQRSASSLGGSDRPRAHSVSGEIRPPVRRAPSIRPPLPAPDEEDDDDDDEPVIVIEPAEPEPGQTRKLPPRRRIVKTDPPELQARAGEVDLKSGADRAIDANEPRIVVDLDMHDDSGATLVRERRMEPDSAPILLDRPRGTPEPFASALPQPDYEDSEETTEFEPPEETDVVVLDAPKTRPDRQDRQDRPERHTQVGAAPAPAPVPPRVHHDTETSGIPAMVGSTSRGLDGPTAIDIQLAPDDGTASDEIAAPPAPASDADTNPYLLAAPPAPAPSVSMMRTLRNLEYDPVDDGWGPPGTTIPPPLLGAIPGSEDDEEPGAIPMPSIDSSPLMIGPPSGPAAADGNRALARALDEATGRALDVIRRLERADTRDQVVGVMVGHLVETHRRAGFLVNRHTQSRGATELSLFAMSPKPTVTPYATLRLDRPSTLQEVVGTHLPYRGPIHDDASRTFLIAVLGACPPEILLVPVAVRERVVGVLFGEHRHHHTFDDQVALAARAAGMALERIIKARRG